MTTVDHIRNRHCYPSGTVVYVGRAGHGEDGYFGNPVVPNRPCPVCREVHRGPSSTIPCFEQYARERMAADPVYAARVKGLRGFVLLCFCSIEAGAEVDTCHAQVLSRLAEGAQG